MKNERRSIRVPGFDYAGVGDYFITIVTYHRQSLFGQIVNGEMQAYQMGLIAFKEWFKTARLRKYIELYEDEFVLMPNHIHGIVHILEDVSPANHSVEAPVGAQRRCGFCTPELFLRKGLRPYIC